MQSLVALRHGCDVNGLTAHKVRLREITGHDERYLTSMHRDLPVFLRSAELLSRVVISFEGIPAELRNEALQKLSVGDRVLLLLHVRKMTIGDILSCTLDCPKCGEKMSQDISTNSLLKQAEKNNAAEALHHMVIDDYSMDLRPTTLSDQQQLQLLQMQLQPSSSSEAIQSLARSCIISCNPPLPDGPLHEKLIAAIGEKLREIDPLADIILDVTCPACSDKFVASFDIESFFLEEMTMRSSQLDLEVHWLAFNYHWSEDSILSLMATRRRRYIALINDTLSGVSG